jgi:hypothetical protein
LRNQLGPAGATTPTFQRNQTSVCRRNHPPACRRNYGTDFRMARLASGLGMTLHRRFQGLVPTLAVARMGSAACVSDQMALYVFSVRVSVSPLKQNGEKLRKRAASIC